MPFNYQTLKRLTGTAFVDGSLTAAKTSDRTIETADVGSGAITAAKLSSGAVDLSTNKVTNTLPTSKGGTGLTSVGSNHTRLAVNSSANGLEYRNTGFSGIQVFTGNSTWNRPSGVRYIRVKVQGAGGGGSGHGESGAAGGYAERIMDVTGIPSVGITIGGGGGGTYYAGAAGNAGGTSFGPYISAQGGHGANRQNQHSGGVSGGAGGGDLNIHQGGGGSHHDNFGPGGTSHFGGAGPSGHPQGGHFAHNHQGHSAPGTGGTGGYYHGHRGADGRPGIIVIEEYK
jgi:hypothetical protein